MVPSCESFEPATRRCSPAPLQASSQLSTRRWRLASTALCCECGLRAPNGSPQCRVAQSFEILSLPTLLADMPRAEDDP
jgi:hypothetical protein